MRSLLLSTLALSTILLLPTGAPAAELDEILRLADRVDFEERFGKAAQLDSRFSELIRPMLEPNFKRTIAWANHDLLLAKRNEPTPGRYRYKQQRLLATSEGVFLVLHDKGVVHRVEWSKFQEAQVPALIHTNEDGRVTRIGKTKLPDDYNIGKTLHLQDLDQARTLRELFATFSTHGKTERAEQRVEDFLKKTKTKLKRQLTRVRARNSGMR